MGWFTPHKSQQPGLGQETASNCMQVPLCPNRVCVCVGGSPPEPCGCDSLQEVGSRCCAWSAVRTCVRRRGGARGGRGAGGLACEHTVWSGQCGNLTPALLSSVSFVHLRETERQRGGSLVHRFTGQARRVWGNALGSKLCS